MIADHVLKQITERPRLVKEPVRLVLFTTDVGCDSCPAMRDLVQAVKERLGLVRLETYDMVMDRDKSQLYGITHVPALVIQGANGRFVTFTGLIEDVLLDTVLMTIAAVSDQKVWFPQNVLSTVSHLTNDVKVRVLVDRDCVKCRPVAETAIGLGLSSDLIAVSVIVGRDFPELIKKYRVSEIPKTIFGENLHLDGHIPESEFLEMIFQAEGIKGGPDKKCVVCGTSSPDLICTNCRSKIQAESLEHKLKSERMK
ncbi:MAG TPA: thioredoxin family protein [Nitrospirota bacterium]|nr:thioredoxin family protein [Nitrospirota bacterium]